MDRNKKILLICGTQIAIFLLFLCTLILHIQTGVHYSNGIIMIFTGALILLSLIGCALSFVMLDYTRDVVRFASSDVMGVHNKKALEKKLYDLQEKEDTFNLGIMMFDLNNLKKINDTYGHEQGDVFIKTFASLLTRILTENSFLARYGGDEFVIVEEHTSLDKLAEMNHRLQALVDDYNENALHAISYAVGYDVSYRNHYYLIPDLMKIADEKMYEDKRYKKEHMSSAAPSISYSSSKHFHSVSSEYLIEKLHTILSNHKDQRSYAFVTADIQDFRLINEYCGYETGSNILDTVLKMVEQFPDICFTYRYHADIFVSLVDITNQSVDELRDKIISYNSDIEAHILKQYPVNHFQFRTGIYAIEDDSVIPAEIISHANTVRKLASEVNGHVYIYGPHIAEMEQHRADVTNSFQSAIDNDEICIYMQPKIGCKSKKIESAEVLVRWNKAPGVVWTPDKFLPVLEETGDITTIDYYVYEKAFAWLKERRDSGLPVVPISLNVTPAHFNNITGFEQKVHEIFEKYHPDPSLLIFEITEEAYIHNYDAVNCMIEHFHNSGVLISMDDFGSGYSSLNTMKDIQFDEIKMDKRFLDGPLSTNGKIVIEEIFHMLKRTHHSIVCEGVETKEVADFLTVAGCNEMQGFYYYKPMPSEGFSELLDSMQ